MRALQTTLDHGPGGRPLRRESAAALLRPLTPAHLPELAEALKDLPPYSDFGPASVWSWSTASTDIALFAAGAVLRTRDYVTGKTQVWAAAAAEADRVLEVALGIAATLPGVPAVRLVPEHTIRQLRHPERFACALDRDEYDYVLDCERAADVGSMRKERRAALRAFASRHPATSARAVPLHEAIEVHDLLGTFDEWQASSNRRAPEVEAERVALGRLLSAVDAFPAVVALTLEDAGRSLLGFSLAEPVRDDMATVHFAKADRARRGVFARLALEEARWALAGGRSKLNIEQDLGLAGLRRAKLAERPAGFLRKYTVTWA